MLVNQQRQNPKERPPPKIRIEGWFYVGKSYPNLKDVFLNKEHFKLAVQDKLLHNLSVMLSMEKCYGNFWNSIPVVAVVETTSGLGLIPFFVERHKAISLKKKIENARALDKSSVEIIDIL